MRRALYFLLIFMPFVSCKRKAPNLALDASSQFKFTGIFETRDSDNLKGSIDLIINDGYYHCSSSLPFGRGAGKVEVNSFSINFIDTLFFPIPTIWGPSYVLSGEHSYRFDGNHLLIWKEKNIGSVHYKLKLAK
ncbi:hypothetical protein [Ravibacter arvi]|uniref:hypothetical protein n=1 Tax=Ravibacter arvi TaxID=2051041 RepID=UPI0031F0F043